MTVREVLNAILVFINTPTLSDDEWSTLESQVEIDSEATVVYEALLGILNSRETVSGAQDRLAYYFLAKGVEIPRDVTGTGGKSNIYLGDVL